MAVESLRFRKEAAKRPLDQDALLTCKQEPIEAAEVPKRIKLDAAHEQVLAQANLIDQLIKLPQASSKTANPTQNAVIQLKKLPPLPPKITVKLEPEEEPQVINNNSSFKESEVVCQPEIEKPLNDVPAVPVIKAEIFDDRLTTPSPLNSSSSTALSEDQKSLPSSASGKSSPDLQTTEQTLTKSSSKSAISMPNPSKLQLGCKACPAKVATLFELLRHHSTFHKPKPDLVLHECELCHKKFHYRKSLICHQKTHTSTWVTCPLCDRNFKNDIDKNRHYKEIHGDPPKYKCQICGDCFRTPGSIIDHVQVEHRTPKALSSTSRLTRSQSRRTRSAQQLRSQIGRHSGTQGRTSSDSMWSCSVCGQEFTSESVLTRHYRKRRVDPMTCELCSKVFCYETRFLKHMKKEHQHQSGRDLNQEACSKCRMDDCICGSDSFFNNEQVQVSRGPVSGMEPQETPSPRRPRRGFSAKKTINVMKTQRFSCEDCESSFKTKKSLEAHRIVHTGEKPYACGLCDKRFNGYGGLWTHKKRNHKNV